MPGRTITRSQFGRRTKPPAASVPAALLAAALVLGLVLSAGPLLAQAGRRLPSIDYCPERVLAYGEVEGTFQRLSSGEADVLVLKLGDGREAAFIGGPDIAGFTAPAGTRVKAYVERVQQKGFGERYGEKWECVPLATASAIWRAATAPTDPCPERLLQAGNVEAAYHGLACGDGCRLVLKLDDGEVVEVEANHAVSAASLWLKTGDRVRAHLRRERVKERGGDRKPTGRCLTRIRATDMARTSDSPIPSTMNAKPADCPAGPVAEETIFGAFRGMDCGGNGGCAISFWPLDHMERYYPAADPIGSFKAPAGTLIEVRVERRQAPGEGDSLWPSGGCRWSEVATSVTIAD